jgi:hypothetical protein
VNGLLRHQALGIPGGFPQPSFILKTSPSFIVPALSISFWLVGTFSNFVPLLCNLEYLPTVASRNEQAILDQLI